MAHALSQEVRGPEKPEPIQLEKADFWADVKTWDPRSSFAICVALGALSAYVTWFGILAIFDVWRRGMLDIEQLGIVMGGLILQSCLTWALRLPQLLGAVILGVLMGVPATLATLSSATSGDYLHATLFILTPIVLFCLNGWLVAAFLKLCALPTRRGG